MTSRGLEKIKEYLRENYCFNLQSYTRAWSFMFLLNFCELLIDLIALRSVKSVTS